MRVSCQSVFRREKVIILLFICNVNSEGIENNESGITICLISERTDSGAVLV